MKKNFIYKIKMLHLSRNMQLKNRPGISRFSIMAGCLEYNYLVDRKLQLYFYIKQNTMKNLTKFILGVAALATLSCTTDVTEDLGVAVGGQTTISLSLDESRTHINGKVGDEYPLYWSKGDKIAVNGVVSEPLSESSHGNSNATFTLNGVVEYPYNIVYPAPASDVTAAEGLQAVSFLATQEYTAGTFAEGAAPMYAQVASAGDAAVLNHLAGVLCIAPKGEGVVLASMSVTAVNGKIAGNYDVDCATGALTAHDDAVSTLTVTFGDGLALGAEATPIYVAVPAGEYSVVETILTTTTGEIMSVLFKASGDKAVKAGVVREFTEFAFESNIDDSAEFVIDSKETLIRFAMSPSKSAVVTAAIDMTGYDWTPIEGFAHAFDGGNFEIKGLNAPLFGETTATEIKNVKLTNVDITDAGLLIGAIARSVTNADAVISNCYANGTITANNSSEITSDANIAGLIGSTTSKNDLTNLTNEVDINVTGVYEGKYCFVAGCVSSATAAHIKNATNLGNITYSGGKATRAALSGISSDCRKYTNCVNGAKDNKNKGNLTYDCTTESVSFYAGGILQVANKNLTAVNCVNYGSITATERSNATGHIIGGVFGNCDTGNTTAYTQSFDNCHNHGDLSIKSGKALGNVKVGGGFAQFGGDKSTFTILNGFSNSGNIHIEIGDAVSGKTVLIAGVVSTLNRIISTSSTGIISNSGKITFRGHTSASSYTRLGGVYGHTASAPPSHAGISSINTGDIDAEGAFGKIGYVGGISATGRNIANGRSVCNIKAVGYTYVGMGIAQARGTYKIQNCHIGGSIWKEGDSKVDIDINNFTDYIYSSPIDLATAKSENCGFIANIDDAPAFDAPYEINSAETLLAFAAEAATFGNNISITADIDLTGIAWTPIDGYKGAVLGNGKKIKGLTAPLFGTSAVSISNLHLVDAAILITDVSGLRYGAFACKIEDDSAIIRDCSAEGYMKFECDAADMGKDVYVGGIVGEITTLKTCSNLCSKLEIIYNGSYKDTIRTGGLIGDIRNGEIANSSHLGTITFNGTTTEHVVSAGMVAYAKALTNCTNGDPTDSTHTKGSVIFNGSASNPYSSGIVGTIATNITATNCHNYGTLGHTAESTSTGTAMLGGMGCYFSSKSITATFDNCSNNAPLFSDLKSANGIKVGGCLAHLGEGTLNIYNGYVNHGDITVNQATAAGGVQVGGMFGNFSGVWTTASTGGLYNSGDITYTGASTASVVKVAGITAAMAKNIPTIEGFEIINIGNISSKGTGKEVYVGGILGTGKLVSGAKCHCKIYTNDNVTASGWIMAAAYSSSAKATNCQIGGYTVEIDDADESEKLSPITEENYINYIYSANITKEEAEADGCSFLAAKPTIQ